VRLDPTAPEVQPGGEPVERGDRQSPQGPLSARNRVRLRMRSRQLLGMYTCVLGGDRSAGKALLTTVGCIACILLSVELTGGKSPDLEGIARFVFKKARESLSKPAGHRSGQTPHDAAPPKLGRARTDWPQ